MAVKPMLGDLPLQLVDEIESDQDRVLVQHPVPGLEGDFTSDLGTRSTTITLSGAVEGEQVGDELKKLREKFQAAEPVAFAADIATAVRVQDVLVEEMGVRELAGKTGLFEYAFTLREFAPAPKPEEEPPPVIPPPPIEPTVGRLEVEVVLKGLGDVDPDTILVSVEGTQDDSVPLRRTLKNRTGLVWTETDFPPGKYTARATLSGPPARQGEVAAVVKRGQLTHVVVTIAADDTALVATTFVIHFHFDKAFVEPCMRDVLAQVAEHAVAHKDQKLLVVGHTDLTGSDEYNQSLSERRARAAFAMLTSGSDAATARTEWNELRQARPVGTVLSLHDTWGRREQQWMLRDLGLYHGNIDTEKPLTNDIDLTRQAVIAFQNGHGLNPTGVVDDATWTALIDAYLSLRPLSIDPAQLLPNKGSGCDGGPLKWLGAGEKDPIDDTLLAERRNRRVELLFVTTDHLPADVKQPDTFNLPPAPGAVAPRWCLNPGKVATHTCFVRMPHPKEICTNPDKQRFSRVPAEPGNVHVTGSITFEDGTPLANTPFVLFAPSGKIMTDENRDGDLRGWAIAKTTGPQGTFSFDDPQGIGVYTMEVRARVVARQKGEPLTAALNNVVCARLKDPQSVLEIIVTSIAAAGVKPAITAPRALVVRKPGCNPRRQPVRLSVGTAFTGSGTFTRSSDAVRFFDAAVGGNEITFNGADNVFTDAALLVGVQLFAEAQRASAAVDDVVLRIALTVGGQPGLAAEAKLTAVALTIDICETRTSPVTDPPALAAAAKIAPGRFVHLALPDFSHERAMLLIRPPQPAAFASDLVLTPVTAGVQAFAEEIPAAGQVPTATFAAPQVLPAVTPPADRKAFAEGAADSALAGESGFFLGLAGIEPEGDRVSVTVGHLDFLDTGTAAAPAVAFTRIGLWDHAFNAAGVVAFNVAAEASNFVGADTRHLFLRLRDASRAGFGSTLVEWRAVQENDDELFPPADHRVTLVETGPKSGLFISRALLLVTDEDDYGQANHSGLPAGMPDGNVVRTRGQSNHRLRRADVRSRVVCTYPHPAVPAVRVSRTVPVFDRNPESRRRVQVQVFVLRVAPGGNGTVPPAAIFANDLQVMRETYARLGVEIDTVVAAADRPNVVAERRPVTNETVRLTGPQALVLLHAPVADDPVNTVLLAHNGTFTVLTVVTGRAPNAGEIGLDLPTGRLTLAAPLAPGDFLVASYISVGHEIVLIDAPAGVSPLAVTLADHITLATAHLSLPDPAHPGVPGTVRVFFTGGLTSLSFGDTRTETDFPGSVAAACSFINGPTRRPYTTTHEVGHTLIDKGAPQHGGHYLQPAAPPGNLLFTNQNLMRGNGTSEAHGVNESKRLWDAPDLDGVNQFVILTRHFSRPF